MASGDFLDLAEHACRASQLDPSDTTDLTQAKAKVNEGYLSCCHSGDPWDFLEKEGQWDTVAGSGKYTYASIATAMSISGAAIREITKMVNDDTGTSLSSMDWEALEELTDSTQEAGESRGEPLLWSKWGSQGAPTIRLYPTPDAAYTLAAYCSLAPAELSATTDVPLLPLAWRHRLLVPYAAWRLLSQEGGTEAMTAARIYREEYEDSMTRMRTALATARRPTFNLVQPGFAERQLMGR